MLDEFESDINDILEAQASKEESFSAPVYEKQYLTLKIQSLVASANEAVSVERQINVDTALKVAGRSLKRTIYDLTNPERRAFTALREVSDFIRVYTTGDAPKVSQAHSDLLPLGHPLSSNTADEATTLVASAIWHSGDPRVPQELRSLVASALASEENSIERIYASAYLSGLKENKPVELISNLIQQ